MLIGVAFYSFIIGMVTAFFTSKETKNSLLFRKIAKLDDFSKAMDLKPNLQEEIKSALEYSSRTIFYLWLDADDDIFFNLPVSVKYEFLKAIYHNLLRKSIFFQKYDKSFAIRIVPLLNPLIFKCGEYIWEEGDYASNIVFLVEGKVNFFIEDEVQDSAEMPNPDDLKKHAFFKLLKRQNRKNSIRNMFDSKEMKFMVFKQLEGGSYFGEADIINNRRRNCYAVAVTDCEAFTLPRNVYLLLSKNPSNSSK